MFNLEEIKEIQNELIEKFGGVKGIRDINLLESAVKRPFMIFENKDLYKTNIEKAIILLEGVIKNHPFIDGNKRIGYFLFRAFLLSHKLDINADENEKYQLIIKIASNKISTKEIMQWIENHIINIK